MSRDSEKSAKPAAGRPPKCANSIARSAQFSAAIDSLGAFRKKSLASQMDRIVRVDAVLHWLA